MSYSYKPRRSTQRWLEGAPKALLAVYDNGGKSFDRYTALYGAPLWSEQDYGKRRMVPARFMSEHPSHPQGFGIFGEHPSCDRACLGKKVRFSDLPEDVKRCIISDCSEEE
jgi:hypothetical protein